MLNASLNLQLANAPPPHLSRACPRAPCLRPVQARLYQLKNAPRSLVLCGAFLFLRWFSYLCPKPHITMKKILFRILAALAAPFLIPLNWAFGRTLSEDNATDVDADKVPQNATQGGEVASQAAQNRAAFNKSMSIWNSTQRKPAPMREAYTSQDGTVYYEYADIGDLPLIRSQKLQECLLKLAWGITPDYMAKVFIPKYSAAAEARDANALVAVMSDFINRYQLAPEIPTMCELAALLFIRHDENPYAFNPIIHAQKIKHATSDYELQAFFLRAAWEIAKVTMAQSLENWRLGSADGFLDYLEGRVPTRK